MHFNGSNARGYYEEFAKNGYHLLQCQEESHMEESLRRIIGLHTRTDATTELLCSKLITDILTEFLEDACTGSQPDFVLPEAVQQTRRYIDRHFREPLSLEELADRIHLSKYHLSHTFKKYMGVPVNEYIILSRISYAKELLRFSRLSVSEITYEIGFNQPSYFIRTFKERESLTPSQYRRQWTDS
jgi:YesN/AraC family two-component response regulator